MTFAQLVVTGPREGIRSAQAEVVSQIFRCNLQSNDFYLPTGFDTVHHGDCTGFDAFIHGLTEEEQYSHIHRIIHPPKVSTFRAFCKCTRPGDEMRHEEHYLVRDRRMVSEGDMLLAAPKTYTQQLHSGTWYTVRHARKKLLPTLIVWPNGEHEFFEKGFDAKFSRAT